jgi:hypothetical protein
MPRNDPAARGTRRRIAGSAVALAAVLAGLAAGGCRQRADTGFSLDRASRHVRMLAADIGNRPTGTAANRRARDYVVDQLRQAGFDVRVQEAFAEAGPGRTTPVANVIAIKPGRQAEAVALVSHYDSPPESPAAADDGLGVAVCLEAGRVLAERANARYTLLVVITDGEELGLMGARAISAAPEFGRLRAFLNFESIGTRGPARLFQSGPDNFWLARAWAAAARFPAGSSLYTEIYRRLPNGTDFTVLASSGAPGLDFAPTGNSFAYHTPLDTPDRLDPATLDRLGNDAVNLVSALDGVDIAERTRGDGTFFDTAGVAAFAYSVGRERLIAALALVLGLLAAYKAFQATRHEVGMLRVFTSVVWTIFGVAACAGALCLGCWLLRAGRGLQNPWYAQAALVPAFLAAVGLGAWWVVVQLGRALPATVSPSGRPCTVWMIALPVWIALAALTERTVPGAGYLFTIPLLTASALVLGLPMRQDGAGRIVSAVVTVVACALWAPLLWPLAEFLVALFGSLAIPAPVWVLPAFAIAGTITLAPSAAGLVLGRETRVLPASAIGSLLVLAVAGTAWIMAVEPAYTAERPERRTVRYLQDMVQQKSLWEVGTHERDGAPAGPHPSAPQGWQSADQPPALSVRIGPVRGPYRYRARGGGLVAPPLDVRCTMRTIEGTSEAWLETVAVPQLEGTGVVFDLPWGVKPLEASLRGAVRDGRWSATVMPLPASGVTLRVRLSQDDAARLYDGRVTAAVHGVPGGVGWQRLPPWLPQATTVWTARSLFILPWPAPTRIDAAAGTPPGT